MSTARAATMPAQLERYMLELKNCGIFGGDTINIARKVRQKQKKCDCRAGEARRVVRFQYGIAQVLQRPIVHGYE